MKILIADDDFVNRRLLEAICVEYGNVVTVEDGMSAVEEAAEGMKKQERYDLICLDVMMTRLDGYKALEAIREAEKKFAVSEEEKAKIVMISALDEVTLDNVQICDDYDAYICKPIVVEQFEKTLEKMDFNKLEI